MAIDRNIIININDVSPLANTAYVDAGKDNKTYNKAQVNELVEDLREGALGSISPLQTLPQLNVLPDGNYYASEAGDYAFGVTVPIGWQYRFNKTGSIWKVLTKIEMPAQDLSVIESEISNLRDPNFKSQSIKKEYFDSNTAQNGYYNSSGVFVENESFKSLKLKVSAGDIIEYKGKPYTSLQVNAVIGLNSDSSFNSVLLGVVDSSTNYTTISILFDGYIVANWATNSTSFSLIRNEDELLIDIDKFVQIGVTNRQLFNKSNQISNDDYSQFGWIKDKYISNSDYSIKSAVDYYLANIPLFNYPNQTKITISGVVIGAKYYRVVDKNNTILLSGVLSTNPITIDKPLNSHILQFTFKIATNPISVIDTLMVNFGTNAEVYQTFERNPNSVKQINNYDVLTANNVTSNNKINTNRSIAFIGNSITANGATSSTLIGYQQLLSLKYIFNKLTTYGYPGKPFGTFVAAEGTSIVEQFINHAVSHDIFMLVCPSTNDFKLETRLGSIEDYKNLSSYGSIGNVISMNFYQSLKAFILRCYELNPKALIIFTTDLQRNNSVWNNGTANIPYDTNNPNSKGISLRDFAKAIREVADYESIPVIDFMNTGVINIKNINQYTSDGLHPNNIGYEIMSYDMINMLNNKLGIN